MIAISKTALITGASGDIGSAVALRLAADGYNVVINYLTDECGANRLADELNAAGAKYLLCKADVADESQVNKMFQNATEIFGGVSVLVNNAGIALQKLFTDTGSAEFEHIIAVNLSGAANCCRAAIPYMVRQKSGSIINVSSMWGVCGASCEAAYSASKAGLIGLSKALARELAPSNIRVNCITPGVIDTKMNSHLSPSELDMLREEIPLRRMGRPEEIASLISFLAGDGAEYITAQVIGIDGGFI